MRIAIVSDFFLDYVGGAQSSMRQQQRALTQAGHHVVMLSSSRHRGARYQQRADGLQVRPVFTVPGVVLPVIPNRRRLVNRLERYFRAEAIDVVHVQTEFGLAHAAAYAARRMGIRVVHTVHTFYWSSAESWHAPLAPFIRAVLGRLVGAEIPRRMLSPRPVDNVLRNITLAMAMTADVVVSPSAHQASDLRAAGVTGRIETVPNPVARAGAAPVRLTADTVSPPSFLWAARCSAEKRPLVFAEAAILALGRLGPAFRVHFVGDGPELTALQRATAAHPEITVHGSLSHAEVLALMDDASAVVLTSVGFDNQPMTIAEAVSRSRGVLYCDPKLSEGLGQAGYLAASPDAAGLADAIVELVSDPSRLVALSAGAVRDQGLFSPETYVSRILGVYAA